MLHGEWSVHHHHHHFYLSPYGGYVLVELLCTQKKKNEKTIMDV